LPSRPGALESYIMKGNSGQKRRRARKLGRVERDILKELSFGDFLYSALLSARSTKLFYKLARERATNRYRRKLAIERLKELEFIEERSERLSITDTGRSAIGTAIESNRKLLETEQWDYKWRIAVFDIPEKYSSLRKKVRDILRNAGFVKLQQSIWIFPHDCEELVRLIKSESRLSEFILYGVLEKIEGSDRLKRIFKL
jgi:hypothetical protein